MSASVKVPFRANVIGFIDQFDFMDMLAFDLNEFAEYGIEWSTKNMSFRDSIFVQEGCGCLDECDCDSGTVKLPSISITGQLVLSYDEPSMVFSDEIEGEFLLADVYAVLAPISGFCSSGVQFGLLRAALVA